MKKLTEVNRKIVQHLNDIGTANQSLLNRLSHPRQMMTSLFFYVRNFQHKTQWTNQTKYSHFPPFYVILYSVGKAHGLTPNQRNALCKYF